MSPRPKNLRTVFDPPRFKGFSPYGFCKEAGEPVPLLFEEFTALKLCDYELMTQAEAAKEMKVSRPTFTRLYESARRKIAEALAEARPLEIERGHAFFSHNWRHCSDCSVFFNTPGPWFSNEQCPVCHSSCTVPVNETPQP